MSVIESVLSEVITMAETTAGIYADIVIGSLPPDNGISAYISAGSPVATDLQKGFAYTVTIVINAKNTSQCLACGVLNDIHQTLTQTESYPSTTTYQITDIATVGTPSYLGREKNSQWLYGSSILVKFYYKKGNA